jgi:CheY-like chemotaxis protein
LESLGYAVREARSGPDALEILNGDDPIELVFSGVMMPGGMTGFEVARWIRSRKPSIKVLLTSGYNQIKTDLSEQADIRVLAKPHSRAQLGHAVRKAIVS